MLFFSTLPSLEPGYIYVQNINATLLLATALSRNIIFHTSIYIYIYIYIYKIYPKDTENFAGLFWT